MSTEIVASIVVAARDRAALVHQLATLQRKELIRARELRQLNEWHRMARAKIRWQAQATDATRERVLALERLALVGNMAALALGVLRLAEDLRGQGRISPGPGISTKDERERWINAQGGVHSVPPAPVSHQDAEEPEQWTP